MSLYGGIDVDSNNVWVVLIDEDTMEATWHRYRIDNRQGDDAFDRARTLRDFMPARSAWADRGVLAIGIEKPMAFARMGGIVPQMRVQGALLACLPPPKQLAVYEFVPARWKKRSIGHGHATKEDGATWVRQNITWRVERGHVPQDVYDAACIAQAARITHAAEEGAAAA